MNRPPVNPRLKACADEIRKVLDRYDLMASVTIADGLDQCEYLNAISGQSWSCITVDEGRIRIRARVASTVGEEQEQERKKFAKTVSALVHLRDQSQRQLEGYQHMVYALETQVGLIETGPPIHTPHKGGDTH